MSGRCENGETNHENNHEENRCCDGGNHHNEQTGLVNVNDSFNDNEINVASNNDTANIQVGADNVIV